MFLLFFVVFQCQTSFLSSSSNVKVSFLSSSSHPQMPPRAGLFYIFLYHVSANHIPSVHLCPLRFTLSASAYSVHESSTEQASALVTLPDATSPAAFLKWATNLPASNPPTWLGLAPNAEAALLASRGEQLLSSWQVPFFPVVRSILHSPPPPLLLSSLASLQFLETSPQL